MVFINFLKQSLRKQTDNYKMKILPKNLEKNSYVLFEKLKHAELMEFLNDKNKSKGIFFYIFMLCLFIPIPLISYFLTFNILKNNIGLFEGPLLTLLGIGLVFIFIPIHELLHALAYKAIGAKNISYYSNIKKFYFATVSDKSVINLAEFKIVAFLPFLVVIISAILLFPLVSIHFKTIILGFVSAHTFFCSGDFALSNFMQNNKNKGIVTFDDAKKEETYFYIKKV